VFIGPSLDLGFWTMSRSAFIEAQQQHRHARGLKLSAAGRARERRYAAAVRFVNEHMADLCPSPGQTCPYAVWAVLDLTPDKTSGGKVDLGAVRNLRAARLNAHAEWLSQP
jgi:hypothetical protein